VLDFYINLNIRFKNYFDNSMEEFNMLSKEDQEFRDNIACLNAIGPDTADSFKHSCGGERHNETQQ
jgi:hypothetical protein